MLFDPVIFLAYHDSTDIKGSENAVLLQRLRHDFRRIRADLVSSYGILAQSEQN